MRTSTLREHLSGWRRGVAVGAGLVIAAGLATGVAQFAGASPQPTISQVQAKINQLQAQFD